ncbi:Histone deacetylase complex subunit [Neurospora sp. IMI 360204]|nr:Histone deacetylase complex subunit [Neurospora sp. IMI 360204]
MAHGDDDAQDEDEAVRCICGYEDYPGPPPFDEDSKHGLKDGMDIDPIFATDVTDDAAGFFVQCDICKVWQHGACVGIMTEESSPDEYFCEECRKEFHKIFTASNGQRYSHYLPLKRPSRTTSRSASLNKDGTRSPPKDKPEGRNGRGTTTSSASKRRSTMNSRGADYDEAEALRRAIEASKEDAAPEQPETTTRRTKRGRSDSEEKPENKRQRTSSRSASPSLDKTTEDSDDAGTTTRNGAKSRSRGGAAGRTLRTEKTTEREERERQRAEAANKRKGRAERRRADDSDPSDELPLAARAAVNKTPATTTPAAATTAATTTTTTTTATPGAPEEPVEQEEQPPAVPEPPPTSQSTPEDPPAAATPTAKIDKKRSHKKKGRNQYMRDDNEPSPARSQSGEAPAEVPPPSKPSKAEEKATGHGKHGKNKGGMSSKITMTDMKRRAAALLDFISRTQVELAGESPSDDDKTNDHNVTPQVTSNSEKPLATGVVGVNGSTPSVVMTSEGQLEKDFKELSCVEMMDSLTRRLVKWQQEYTI